ncbi:MAG TPA: hypothetical protein VMU51_38490, partial [Mycobacteriales bacterium]|nr:hypothetical protein [Mycobacteriales bacterium]
SPDPVEPGADPAGAGAAGTGTGTEVGIRAETVRPEATTGPDPDGEPGRPVGPDGTVRRGGGSGGTGGPVPGRGGGPGGGDGGGPGGGPGLRNRTGGSGQSGLSIGDRPPGVAHQRADAALERLYRERAEQEARLAARNADLAARQAAQDAAEAARDAAEAARKATAGTPETGTSTPEPSAADTPAGAGAGGRTPAPAQVDSATGAPGTGVPEPAGAPQPRLRLSPPPAGGLTGEPARLQHWPPSQLAGPATPPRLQLWPPPPTAGIAARAEADWQQHLQDLREKSGGAAGEVGDVPLALARQHVRDFVQDAVRDAAADYRGRPDLDALTVHVRQAQARALQDAWAEVFDLAGVDAGALAARGIAVLPAGGVAVPGLPEPAAVAGQAHAEAQWQQHLQDLREKSGGAAGEVGDVPLALARQHVRDFVQDAMRDAVASYGGRPDLDALTVHLRQVRARAVQDAWAELLDLAGADTGALAARGIPVLPAGGVAVPGLPVPAVLAGQAHAEATWRELVQDLRDKSGGDGGVLGDLTLEQAGRLLEGHVEAALDEAMAGADAPGDPAALDAYLDGVAARAERQGWALLLGDLGVRVESLAGRGLLPGAMEPAGSGPLPGGRGYYFGAPTENAAGLAAAQRALPLFPDAFVVAAHTERFGGGLRVLLPDGRRLAAAEFAEHVSQLPGYRSGLPVVLIICSAATLIPGKPVFASRFAAALGTEVWASTTDVWQTRDGRVLATDSTVGPDGTMRPRFRPDGTGTGQWLRFPAPAGTPTAQPPATQPSTAKPSTAKPSTAKPRTAKPRTAKPTPRPAQADLIAAITAVIPPPTASPPPPPVANPSTGAAPATAADATAADATAATEPGGTAAATAGAAAATGGGGLVRAPGELAADYRWAVPLTPTELAAVAAAGAAAHEATSLLSTLTPALATSLQLHLALLPVRADLAGRRAALVAAERSRVLRLIAVAPTDQAAAMELARVQARVRLAEAAWTIAMNAADRAEQEFRRAAQAAGAPIGVIRGYRESVREVAFARALDAALRAGQPQVDAAAQTAARQGPPPIADPGAFADRAVRLVPHRALLAALPAVEAAAARPVDADRARREAEAVAEAQIRARTARAEKQAGEVRYLPPRSYTEDAALGLRGRVAAFAGTALANGIGEDRDAALRDALLRKLPLPDDPAAILAITAALEGLIAAQGGAQEFARLLVAGNRFEFHLPYGPGYRGELTWRPLTGGPGLPVPLDPDEMLELLDLPLDEVEVRDEVEGNPADLPNEWSGSAGRTQSTSVTVNVPLTGNLGPELAGYTTGVTTGFALSGTGSISHGVSRGGSVSDFLDGDYSGRWAWFQRQGELQLRLTPPVGVVVTWRSPIAALLRFPQEQSVPVPPTDPAARAQWLARQATVQPIIDQLSQPLVTPGPRIAPPTMGTDEARTIRQLESVLSYLPASVTAVSQLRPLADAVLAWLGGAGVRSSTALQTQVHGFLTEKALLPVGQLLISSGAPSKPFDLPGGGWLALVVKAGLRAVRRVGIAEVAPKLEVRQGTVSQGSGGNSGGVTFGPSAKFGVNFDHPDQKQFGGGITVPAVQFDASSSTRVGRSMSSFVGGGDWRGVRQGNWNVLYRVEVRLAATVLSSVPAARTEVGQDSVLYVRVPLREAPRFERLVRQAHLPDFLAASTDAAYAELLGDANDLPTGTLGTALPLPPPVIANELGIGPAAPSWLGGSDQVVPQLLTLLQQADRQGTAHVTGLGVPRWTDYDKLHVQRLLNAYYSQPALRARASTLLAKLPGTQRHPRAGRLRPAGTPGLSLTFERWTPGGVVTYQVTVWVERTPNRDGSPRTRPLSTGRIGDADVNLIPTYFAGIGSAGSVSTTLGFGVQIAPSFGVSIGGTLRTFGFSVQGRRSGTASAGSGVDLGVFTVRGALFSGPALTFDYPIDWHAEVSATFAPGPALTLP